MHELDVPVIVTLEREAYQFPWSEGIFRDCLRVGYICRVIEVGSDIAGYGIMSAAASIVVMRGQGLGWAPIAALTLSPLAILEAARRLRRKPWEVSAK